MEGSSLLENLSVEVVRESPFISKSANEWMSEAKEKPIQRRLFGNLWFENELAILFAETNAGKSILAVQIADSISKGCPIPPFGMDANKQRVVYFDFELSEKQFEKRYSINGTEHYIFDEDLIRVENNPYADYPDGDYASFICDSIEECILHFNAKVAIIDNITYLNDELEKSKFFEMFGDPILNTKSLPVKKLKELSVLITNGNTPKGGSENYVDDGILFLRSQNIFRLTIYQRFPRCSIKLRYIHVSVELCKQSLPGRG